MKTVRLICDLTFDESNFEGNSTSERDWFYSHILKNDLILHSNDIGDSIGELKVIRVDRKSSK